MEKINQVLEQTLPTSSPGNKPTTITPETISTDSRFSDHEKDMAIEFFSRIQTIYGKGRCGTLFKNADELKVMRKEWAPALGWFNQEMLDAIFARLKLKLAEGDERFLFPDVARILSLASAQKTEPAHRRFAPPALPEPEWRRRQRYECGLLAAKTCQAVLNGNACFLEDKPRDQ